MNATTKDESNGSIDLGKNIEWLGRSGIRMFGGLRIAYLSGVDSDILGSEVLGSDSNKHYLGNYFLRKDIENLR